VGYVGSRVFREGTALGALESVDSRRYLPHALVATLLTIVAPALVVVALSPLSGVADLVLSALLATGLSVAAGSVGATLWTRLPASREIPFGDLMLWSWARRVRAERRLARAVDGGAPLGSERELGQLRTLAVVFEARDGFVHGHSGRVARHAERIARRMGLPDEEIERIEAAASVHDVGMVRVPRAVLALSRDGNLGEAERGLLQRHAVEGAERVAAVADARIAALVRHQHERYDGDGYPDRLAGEQIPLGARIVAVANRFDELMAPAPGRSARGRRNAFDELSERAGGELDPAVVAAFAAYYSGSRSIAGVALAATAPQRAVRWLAAAPGATLGAAGGPVALQSMCAAGATVLAGACLTGLPATGPQRDGDRAATKERRAGGGPGEAATAGASTALAQAPSGANGGAGGGPSGGDDGDGAPRRGGDGRGDAPAADPQRSPAVPTPDGGSGGGTPTAPGTDGGSAPPTGGGGDGSTGPTPGGSTTAPPQQPTAPSPAPAPTPAPTAPLPPSNTVSQVVDPVLDGVGEAVPPAKPVTDVVKGLVGGLTGGLTGAR
jgi:HD-GYP domain-containing protein (c-di-GMP phosphodiesterase class II)